MRTALALLLATGPVLVPVVANGSPCDVSVTLPAYSPDSVTVAPGAAVTWCWTGDEHSVTGDGFDSGVRGSGATFQHTFTKTGTYGYHCTTHSSMVASVTVAAPSSAGPADPTPPPPMRPPPYARTETTAPPPSTAAMNALVGTAPPRTVAPAPARAPAPVIAPSATTSSPPVSAAGVAPRSAGRPYVLGLLGGLLVVAGGAYAVSKRRSG